MSDAARLILGGDKDEIIRRLYGEANVTLHDLDVMREQLRAARRDLAAALVVVRAARIARVRRWQANRRMSDYRREVYARGSADAAARVADIAYSDWHAAERAYRAALAAYVRGEGR